MDTDALIRALATGDVAVDPSIRTRRWLAGLAIGVVLAVAIMATVFGIRWEMTAQAGEPMLWIKFAYVGALSIGALALAARLGRPGARLRSVATLALAPFAVMWILAAFALGDADAARRRALMLGQTWTTCGLNIALIASPVFVALLWILRGLAPTRLALAGGGAGFAAGAVGAFVYAFHCPELAAPFLGLWYAVGIAIPAAIGAIVGPRVLRW
jgi:hypothetical protein